MDSRHVCWSSSRRELQLMQDSLRRKRTITFSNYMRLAPPFSDDILNDMHEYYFGYAPHQCPRFHLNVNTGG